MMIGYGSDQLGADGNFDVRIKWKAFRLGLYRLLLFMDKFPVEEFESSIERGRCHTRGRCGFKFL